MNLVTEDPTKDEPDSSTKLVRLTLQNHRTLRMLSAERGTTIQALTNAAVEKVYGVYEGVVA